LGRRAAGQNKACGFLLKAECFALVLTMHHSARNLFAFARTASTVFAAIGQANALAYACSQQSFAAIGIKSTATWLYGNLEAHVFVILEGSEILNP
jgi:hypothetical protein